MYEKGNSAEAYASLSELQVYRFQPTRRQFPAKKQPTRPTRTAQAHYSSLRGSGVLQKKTSAHLKNSRGSTGIISSNRDTPCSVPPYGLIVRGQGPLGITFASWYGSESMTLRSCMLSTACLARLASSSQMRPFSRE